MSQEEKDAWYYLASLPQEEVDKAWAIVQEEMRVEREKWRPFIEAWAKATVDLENKIILEALNQK